MTFLNVLRDQHRFFIRRVIMRHSVKYVAGGALSILLAGPSFILAQGTQAQGTAGAQQGTAGAQKGAAGAQQGTVGTQQGVGGAQQGVASAQMSINQSPWFSNAQIRSHIGLNDQSFNQLN